MSFYKQLVYIMYVIRLHKVLSRLPAVLQAARPEGFYLYRRESSFTGPELRLFSMHGLCTGFMHFAPCGESCGFAPAAAGLYAKRGSRGRPRRRVYASLCSFSPRRARGRRGDSAAPPTLPRGVPGRPSRRVRGPGRVLGGSAAPRPLELARRPGVPSRSRPSRSPPAEGRACRQ